jgi:hypothetical protein
LPEEAFKEVTNVQLTTLNKVIRLFLIGTIAILPITAIYWHEVSRFIDNSQSLGKSSLAIPMSFSFLAVAALIGCVIEGLSDVTLRRFLQGTMRSRSLSKFFLKSKEHDSVSRWSTEFIALAEEIDAFPKITENLRDSSHSLASAILHAKGVESHVKWVDTHYSMFMLSSNFALILLTLALYLPRLLVDGTISPSLCIFSVGGCLFATYCLCIFAVDNYLYAYEAIFRHAYFWISGKRQEHHHGCHASGKTNKAA